ncbi:MAG: DoxX family protein [Rhodobacteraceae bacterium]|nr:DoxX family protein [Paracoccaceae bacterium]
MTAMLDFLPRAGVLVLAGYYLYTGTSNLWRRRLTTAALREKGMPFAALALPLGAGAEVAGSLMLASDALRPLGAATLVAFTVVATAVFHNLLRVPRAEFRQHVNVILNNLALCGGLLAAMAVPAVWGPE